MGVDKPRLPPTFYLALQSDLDVTYILILTYSTMSYNCRQFSLNVSFTLFFLAGKLMYIYLHCLLFFCFTLASCFLFYHPFSCCFNRARAKRERDNFL